LLDRETRGGERLANIRFHRIVRRAREEGHEQVSLSVEKDSPAVAFYERNGFAATGESQGGLVMVRHL